MVRNLGFANTYGQNSWGGCFWCGGSSPAVAATQAVVSKHFQKQGFRIFAPNK